MHIKELKEVHNVRPHGVLHVGAHFAEESQEYISNGFHSHGKIFWVEAQEDLAAKIAMELDPEIHQVICAAAWDKDDEVLEFNITSKDASSSLLELGKHREKYPTIFVERKILVRTSRLDTILDHAAEFDFLVLDIQGAELRALEGLGARIEKVKWIFTEVNREELYLGAALISDFDERLKSLGFKRVFTEWNRKGGWGDALYVRPELYKLSLRQQILKKKSILFRKTKSYFPQWVFPYLVIMKKFLR